MDKNETRVRMNKEDRRLQILDSAMGVFVVKGYNGTTTLDIAGAAKISEVTLFRYFSSKKDIFNEGIEPILITTLEESIVAVKDLEPVEKLEYILTERIKLISKHHKVVRLILMESLINPELTNVDYIGRISQLLKNTLTDMDLHLKDEEFTFRILMGSILSFLYLPEIDKGSIGQFVSNVVSSILNNNKI